MSKTRAPQPAAPPPKSSAITPRVAPVLVEAPVPVETPLVVEAPVPVEAAVLVEAPVLAEAPAVSPERVAAAAASAAGEVSAREFPSLPPARRRRRRWIPYSRAIGTALAIVLLVIALQLLQTPGASADIRELPGQVDGLIQQAVAQPEQGYPRIRIKRVGIDLMLVKGDGKTPPVRYAAFTYPRADHVLAQPGTTGNTYVYAHARTGMFWNLHDVNIGDTVEIDNGGGEVSRYRVSEIHRSVNSNDFTWLQPTADDRITLQTCNGWRDQDPRLVVVAHRVTDPSIALAR